eukprot:TRINITY_DN26146_c0_g1_i1.p1 TRINITY_DN26146_c0_g1~~TRINITY_DN26146_c0_g1_i1.p1  ORF type:complete len:516 (+),score=144.31 TRINITY_DN26146_c0_g1_i1:75-1622(+)
MAAPEDVLSYEDCVAWLASLPPFGGSGGWTLDNTLRLLRRCGNPHLHLPPVVHVTGTNGKGSTVAMVTGMLAAHGLRAATFTSPHMGNDFDKEMTVNGSTIDPLAFRRAVSGVRRALLDTAEGGAEGDGGFAPTLLWLVQKGAVSDECARAAPTLPPLAPSQFEVLAVVAFLAVAKCIEPRPAAFVLEVGLGGRLDCTNVMPPPAVCVFTRIGVDHAKILGDTPADVAREKSGIVKPGVGAVVSYPQTDSAAAEVLRGAVEETGVKWMAEPQFDGDAALVEPAPGAVRLRVQVPRGPAQGAHQLANAGVAAQAVACLARSGCPPLAEVSAEKLSAGLLAAAAGPMMDGRFEVHELPSDARHIAVCDGAHNPDALNALCDTLDTAAPELGVSSAVFVIGMLRDKDIEAAAATYAQFALQRRRLSAEAYAPVTVPWPRQLPAGELHAALQRAGVPPGRLLPPSEDCAEALGRASGALDAAARAGRRCALVFSGSFFLLGPARAALAKAFPGLRRLHI